jgi:hypothetical protein
MKKVLNIIIHQGNTSQNHKEISKGKNEQMLAKM